MQSSNFDLPGYFNLAHQIISEANLQYSDTVDVAGYNVRLATHSKALREQFLPAMAHLVRPAGQPSLTILYADGSTLASSLPPPPRDLTNNQGFADGINQDRYQFFYQPWCRQVFLYSQEQNLGLYWVLNPKEIPWWETTFSFRIIFHWWTRGTDLQLMHAGALCENGKQGWLIPGPSGSGKSTSCLNLLLHGIQYLGDDYVIVKTKRPFTVYSLYQTVKINADNFDLRFASLRNHLQNPETYHQQKAILHASKLRPNQLIKSAPLAGILMPRVAQTPQHFSQTERISPARALLSIAPTTLHHLPHHRSHALEKITRLSRHMPCFAWILGSDDSSLVDSFGALKQ
jgi:hypothetical protein